jgi:hypothetical protein
MGDLGSFSFLVFVSKFGLLIVAECLLFIARPNNAPAFSLPLPWNRGKISKKG